MAVVAVLGASNGGITTAADLTLGGHTVRWWSRRPEALAAARGAGGIALVADGERRVVAPALATDDLAAAVTGAEIVIAPLPATSHDDLAARLGPLLTADQTVLLTPGTLGAYAIARAIARADGRLNRTEATLARLRPIYPAMRPCVDALDAALANAGPVIHPSLVLLNAGAIDGGRFDVHVAGTTPTIRRLIDAVDAERVATRVGWGFPAPHYELATYYDEARAAEGFYGAGARARVAESGIFDETLSFDHRYVTEDVVLGLALFESAARTVGVDTPAISGLLQIFGVILARRLGGDGRALERLGLGDFALREIRALLREGWTSPDWVKAIHA